MALYLLSFILLLTLSAPASSATTHSSRKLRIAVSIDQENQAPGQTDQQLIRIWDLVAQGKLDEATSTYDLVDDGDLKQRVVSHLVSVGLLNNVNCLVSPQSAAQVPFDPPPPADTTCGANHYRLATELLIKGNKMAALNEYCLSASNKTPEVQAWREIGSLLSEAQNYYLSNVALGRYCSMAPQALDFITIHGKMLRLRSRHSKEILQTIAELEIGNPLKIAFIATGTVSTRVAATNTCKIQMGNCIAAMRTGLH